MLYIVALIRNHTPYGTNDENMCRHRRKGSLHRSKKEAARQHKGIAKGKLVAMNIVVMRMGTLPPVQYEQQCEVQYPE